MTPLVLAAFAIWFILFVTFESSHWRCQNKLIIVICTQKDRSLKTTVLFCPNLNHLGLLFPFDMSIDIVLCKWHKIKVFNIYFSPIIHFISVYLIFCKHIASMKSKIYKLFTKAKISVFSFPNI